MPKQIFKTPSETEVNAITGEVLKPTPTVDFTAPQDTPVSDVKGLDSTPPIVATPTEEKAQGFNEQLQNLNSQLIGQSTFRAEQEKAQGLDELQKAQTDLSARLKGLQNEALAIPLQIQNEAIGRGRTKFTTQRMTNERLRENAIKALSVSSLLEASRGNITLAQDLVDRAVAQKFDPIRERINATTKNLNLILKSPNFTLQEKNRANAQLDIQNARKAKVDAQEAEDSAIKKVAIDIAPEIAGLPNGSAILDAIQNATTFEEAQAIALPYINKTAKIKEKLQNQLLQEKIKAEQRKGVSDTTNVGNYSDQELRKLREKGIDSADIESSDRFLYGDKAFETAITPAQSKQIITSLLGLIGDKTQSTTKNPIFWENTEELKDYLRSTGTIDINGDVIKLTDLQREALIAELDAQSQESKGFFRKVGDFFR